MKNLTTVTRSLPYLCWSLAFLGGCERATPTTVEVSGTVTWLGQPVQQGDIIFQQADGTSIPDAGKIIQGHYKLQVKPGKKSVAIHANRETGEIDPTMRSPVRKPYIPEHYNAKTILRAEIEPGGAQRVNFDLPVKH